MMRPPYGKVIDGTEPGASAVFSHDDRYRFMLERQIAQPAGTSFKVLAVCGLNPSTADAFKVDPTVRKEIGFGRAWGCTQYLKANAYGWRDTKPDDMWHARNVRGNDIIGDHNDAWVVYMLTVVRDRGGIALAAWGAHAEPSRVSVLHEIARHVGVEWQCLGTNKGGSPKHPLYLPNASTLQPWSLQ